jgi:hypothetical protein
MSLANNAFGPWVYRGFFEAQTSVKPGFLFGEIRNFNVHFVCANESSTGTMPPLALSGDRNRLGPNTVLSLYSTSPRAVRDHSVTPAASEGPINFCASHIPCLSLWSLQYTYIEKSIILGKILRLRVCSVCQYLLFWQQAVL